MNNTDKIDREGFFKYLKKLFNLSFSEAGKQQLHAVLDYWEKEETSDERLLSYVLASVHHRVPTEGAPQDTVLSSESLSPYFKAPSSEWLKVERLDETFDSTDSLSLANIFYTVLGKMRPIGLSQVLVEELQQTRQAQVEYGNLEDVFKTLHKNNLFALCFSGGGIRSATFGLGIVQALATQRLLTKFDYLSTVSGGGYLGSWLSAWVHRSKDTKPKNPKLPKENWGVRHVQNVINGLPIKGGEKPNPEPVQLSHLREYSNYMSPRTGLLSADTWTLIAIYFRNLFLNLTIFIPLIAALLMMPRLLFRAIG